MGPDLDSNLNLSWNTLCSNGTERDPFGRVLGDISLRDSQSLKWRNGGWNDSLEGSRSSVSDWREEILNNVIASYQSDSPSRNVPYPNISPPRNIPRPNRSSSRNEECSALSLSKESQHHSNPDRNYSNFLQKKNEKTLEKSEIWGNVQEINVQQDKNKNEIQNDYINQHERQSENGRIEAVDYEERDRNKYFHERNQEGIQGPGSLNIESVSIFQSESEFESESRVRDEMHSTVELDNLLLAIDIASYNNAKNKTYNENNHNNNIRNYNNNDNDNDIRNYNNDNNDNNIRNDYSSKNKDCLPFACSVPISMSTKNTDSRTDSNNGTFQKNLVKEREKARGEDKDTKMKDNIIVKPYVIESDRKHHQSGHIEQFDASRLSMDNSQTILDYTSTYDTSAYNASAYETNEYDTSTYDRRMYEYIDYPIRSPTRSAPLIPNKKSNQLTSPLAATSSLPFIGTPTSSTNLNFKSPKMFPVSTTASLGNLKSPPSLDSNSNSNSNFGSSSSFSTNSGNSSNSSFGARSTSKMTAMALRSFALKGKNKEIEVDREKQNQERGEGKKELFSTRLEKKNVLLYDDDEEEEEEGEQRKREDEKERESELEDYKSKYSNIQIKTADLPPSKFPESVGNSPFKDLKIRENGVFPSQRHGNFEYSDNYNFEKKEFISNYDENRKLDFNSREVVTDTNSFLLTQTQREREREREMKRDMEKEKKRESEKIIEMNMVRDRENYHSNYQSGNRGKESAIYGETIERDGNKFLSNSVDEIFYGEEPSFREECSFREEYSLNESHLSGQTQFWLLSDSDEDEVEVEVGMYGDNESTCLFDDSI